MVTLTERHPVPGPDVYGFLRLTRTTRARRRALSAVLDEYCRAHELKLAALFVEHAPGDFYSPAFVGLLDTLALPDAYGVVIPSLGHLGPSRMAAERRRIILGFGARLMQVRFPTPTFQDADRCLS
ncbi:hypothetical protein ABZV67_37455 [Streptomyces sp. NPDC005065]|uniref:hypothetical protein n=1 Tax=Streptomyces sp. NPDC005065 TaxID=3154461 RepID=UPI0033A6823B